MQTDCHLCQEPFIDMRRYDWEDARGWVHEICGVCNENIKNKEAFLMGTYEVKYRADNLFEAVVKVRAANAKDAKRIALQSADVIRLQQFGRVKFSSVRLVGAA